MAWKRITDNIPDLTKIGMCCRFISHNLCADEMSVNIFLYSARNFWWLAGLILWLFLCPIAFASECRIDPAVDAATNGRLLADETRTASLTIKDYLGAELKGRMTESGRKEFMRLTGSAPVANSGIIFVSSYRILSTCPSNQRTYWVDVEFNISALSDDSRPIDLNKEPEACSIFEGLCKHPTAYEQLHVRCPTCSMRVIVPQQRLYRFTFLLMPRDKYRREWVIANPFTQVQFFSTPIAVSQAADDLKSISGSDESKACPSLLTDQYCLDFLKVMASKKRYLQLLRTQ